MDFCTQNKLDTALYFNYKSVTFIEVRCRLKNLQSIRKTGANVIEVHFWLVNTYVRFY